MAPASRNQTASSPSSAFGSEKGATLTNTTISAHQTMEVDSSRALPVFPKREEEAQLVFATNDSAQASSAPAVANATPDAFADKELIPSTSRLSTVPTPPHGLTTTPVAISNHTQNTSPYYPGQDVHSSVNSATSLASSSAPRTFGQPSHPLETSVSSFSQPLTHHGLAHHPIRRPRTSPRVFSSSTDLAAHYGIPQVLPPAPRTTSSRYTQPSAPAPPAPKHQSSPLADFHILSQNYLNMLSKKPTDTSVATTTTTAATTSTTASMSTAPSGAELSAPIVPAAEDFSHSQLQDIADVLGKRRTASPVNDRVTHRGSVSPLLFPYNTAASPEFRDLDSFMTSPMPDLAHDFETSPFETPYSDFLTTPLLDDVDNMLTSPSMEMWEDMPLFPPFSVDEYLKPEETVQAKAPSNTLDTSELYTISPGTPNLDTFDPTVHSRSLHNTSVAPPSPASSQIPLGRRSKATGIRKGVTPEDLLDESAPTQPRKYTTPSATSRKELPAVFARKRSRSAAFGADEEDQLEDTSLPPNPTEKELIEAKRRQNTVAARRSRRRKLEQFQRMEASRNEERQLKEQWQERANVLLKLVRTMGVNYPDFPPDQPQYADA
ncbi:hypothetical protein CVT26_002376 [Gymnopilus dilepis]|uniref:BZIP domain-containing protein n=1 Tax=Gymnopilus dilepis TaxID=231916 RepID=A0A409Y3M4_9AGAR|nr:hypothetical protein CVT26_002376 [Gymnopilus dilepis]